MAQQKGIIKLRGNMGDISFYKTKDGYQAREKVGIDKQRIENDPAFIRTRENNREFGSIGKSGKLFRDALRSLTQNAGGKNLAARVVKIMAAVKNLDLTSARGRRHVGIGIGSAAGKAILKDFNFNPDANLRSIVFRPIELNMVNGSVSIEELVPVNDMTLPPAATHVSFTAAWTKIDFVTATYDIQISEPVVLIINATAQDVTVTPPEAPETDGTGFYLLLVEFFQEINGVFYPLKSGTYNALTILEVV
jgi:hypothetical protein